MDHCRIRTLVLHTLRRVVDEGVRADRALAATLRANRDLSSDERRHVARWSLGLALWQERFRRLTDDRGLWLALLLVEVHGIDPTDASAAAGIDPAVLDAALSRRDEPADPVEALAFRRSLPSWLARRWIDQLGPDKADRLAAASNRPGPITVRTNRLRTTPDELERRLESEGVDSRRSTLVDTALRLEGRPNIVALESWRAGLFEVQDEASQLVAEAVEARPGQTVVDLCAGAGGKTLALAARMEDRGRLVAIEPDADRVHDLSVRLRRAGVRSVEIRRGDGRDAALLADLRRSADAVLVDAPCSGLGILRRGPDSRFRIRPDDPDRFARLQAALLGSAATLVRPGGRLVYATCSVDHAENEAVADAFSLSTRSTRSSRPGFERLLTRRTWPDEEGCDGFFLAVWGRSFDTGDGHGRM